MSQSLSRLLVHLVFSTKNRLLLLPTDFYEPLKQYAYGILEDRKCHLIEMNNVADHVHMLFDLHRTEKLAEVAMHVKKGTSRWLKEQQERFAQFEWQRGYGAFSLGQSQREECRGYIRGQQRHHLTVSYQDEFRKFLHAYEIDFDERYVWD